VNSQQLKVSEFLYLMANGILNFNNGKTSGVVQKTLSSDPASSGSTLSGNLYLSSYVSLAQSIVNYINTNNAAPGSMSTSLGTMSYKTMIYSLAKILNFQSLNDRLPSYVTIDDTVYQNTSTSNSTYNQYLQPTKNCQSTDPTIKALASSLTSGLTSTLAKATAIFNWVRDNTSYSFYYNTKYGAVNTLKNKAGNCVDLSHLLVALSRASGIAAKYVHADATFTSGNVYGHVWAEFLIDGTWVKADASSNSNSLGKITNWNTATAKLKGTYAELPF
jgi:transglutaminase-like putative cysteine protease